MRIFLTGASGYIGSAVVPELIRAGHQVVGLARSDASAQTVREAGAGVRRGDLADLDALRAGAAESDGVVHLAFIHDFDRYAESVDTDVQAIETLGTALAGSDRPLVVAAGVIGLKSDGVATERDRPAQAARLSEPTVLRLAEQGVRAAAVRLAPTVHGPGDPGFVATLIAIAREKGVSAYIGDGANTWPAVHRLDAADLFRRAVESAPAGSVLHGVAEEGVPTRSIAEGIGRHLGLPVIALDPDRAEEHFGWMARMLGTDTRASNTLTQELLGWRPSHPGLLADLDDGDYFAPVPVSA